MLVTSIIEPQTRHASRLLPVVLPAGAGNASLAIGGIIMGASSSEQQFISHDIKNLV